MTSEENMELVEGTSTAPMPVNISVMKSLIVRAAKLDTLYVETLAVMLMTESGGVYMRSESCKLVAESFRQVCPTTC